MSKPFPLLIVTLLAVACLLRSQAADHPYTIAVIPKGTTHEFWKAINAGAVKAQRELTGQGTKVDIIWKGPLREDDRDQSKRRAGVIHPWTSPDSNRAALCGLQRNELRYHS